MSEVLVPIVTFVLGYLVSGLKEWISSRTRKDLIQKALGVELWALLLKLDECKKGAYSLKREKLPFVTASYRTFRPEAAAFLQPEMLLQVDEIYALVKRLNAFSAKDIQAFYSLPTSDVQYLIGAINKIIPSFMPTGPELP